MDDSKKTLDKSRVLSWGADVLKTEARALTLAAERMDERFFEATKTLLNTSGKVVVTGLGKSGHVASKLAATLASTGTPSFFLHPSEALHGDLGMLSENDTLLALAYGGETVETLDVVKYARRINVKVICITGKLESSLSRLSDIVLDGSVSEEACPLNLAPTSSSALALALGDALAIALMRARGFSEQSFANIHPGGSLGKKLMLVSDIMRKTSDFNSVHGDASFSDVMEKITRPNFGIIAVVGAGGVLEGAITDGDIRRALTNFGGAALEKKAEQLMSKKPKTIGAKALAVDAFREMEKHKITSLFVIDYGDRAKLCGLVRMHDLLEQKIV